jgi:glucans biosynthesis protein
VAYWVPERPLSRGDSSEFRYRIHWNNDEPYPAKAARVAATYTGLGGIPGTEGGRPENVRKFVIDFTGGRLAEFGVDDGVKPVVSASGGEVSAVAAYPVVGDKGRFRSIFDLTFADTKPIDLRLFLTHEGEALTETWISQFFPPPLPASAAPAD